jgi:hypothetical protein
MAARRLLIVLLVLLGLSTLAAALLPQRDLRREGTAQTVTSPTQTQATTTASVPNGFGFQPIEITVGGNKIPLVACKPRAVHCTPIHVGDQVPLVVKSKVATELEIPQFGLVAVVAPNAPASFNLIPDVSGTIGILCPTAAKAKSPISCAPTSGGTATNRRVVARVDVEPATPPTAG